jgi:ribosomal-protein-alanine N-acetyltransferase
MSAQSVITIQPMKTEDISEIIRIEQDAFSTPWSESSFRSEIHDPYSLTLIARREGRVVAYICASCRFGEGHILNLAVHPSARRMGIATSLINAVLDYMRENDCVFVYLEVRLSNMSARKLYEQLGFQEVGKRKLYYFYPVEDAVIMMKKL